jgi:hypothetical protein
MPGFHNVSEWAASVLDGQSWISSFRKMPGSVTIAGQWFDFSYAAGMPPANFYASAPLVAAVLDGKEGIFHGPDVSPAKKFIHRITTMMGAASATTVTCQNVRLQLLDYLLYYPFVDMDAAGEDQALTNVVTLPRYTDGEGVMAMIVAQGQTVGGGTFTVNYTNSDGTPGRVSNAHYCAAAQPAGALVSSITAAAGVSPFIALQSGDKGVRSIQSVNFSVANGGIAALVLVKPLQPHLQREEARRTTSGVVTSFGSPKEVESITARAGATEIQDGAFLSFIGQTIAGSVASSQLVGTLETVWR